MTREVQLLSRIPLYRRLWRLLRSDRFLPCVPGHGDMVPTNIIRDPGGRHVVIDWEHGRDMPVALDHDDGVVLTRGYTSSFLSIYDPPTRVG